MYSLSFIHSGKSTNLKSRPSHIDCTLLITDFAVLVTDCFFLALGEYFTDSQSAPFWEHLLYKKTKKPDRSETIDWFCDKSSQEPFLLSRLGAEIELGFGSSHSVTISSIVLSSISPVFSFSSMGTDLRVWSLFLNLDTNFFLCRHPDKTRLHTLINKKTSKNLEINKSWMAANFSSSLSFRSWAFSCALPRSFWHSSTPRFLLKSLRKFIFDILLGEFSSSGLRVSRSVLVRS